MNNEDRTCYSSKKINTCIKIIYPVCSVFQQLKFIFIRINNIFLQFAEKSEFII